MVHKFTTTLAWLLALLLIPTGLRPSWGADLGDREDLKRHYTLSNPTPKNLMRELNSDRPGSTTPPFTIDAGHYEIEVAFLTYSSFSSSDADSSSRVTQVYFPAPTLRIGLTNSLDFGIELNSQIWQQTSAGEASDVTSHGTGDLNLMFKKNFIGNDGGVFSLAAIPMLKIPTNTNGFGNNKWEPSLQLPVAITLTDGWNISFMPVVSLIKNLVGDEMHLEYSSPIALGFHLYGKTEAYVEFVSRSSSDTGTPWQCSVGAGFFTRIAEEMQVDIGFNIGLNSITPQYVPFVGWVYRN